MRRVALALLAAAALAGCGPGAADLARSRYRTCVAQAEGTYRPCHEESLRLGASPYLAERDCRTDMERQLADCQRSLDTRLAAFHQ